MPQPLLRESQQWLDRALVHLAYSQRKLADSVPRVAEMDEETLEAWEGFVARFARASDLFLQKYLRTRVLYDDPAFRGSLRDLLHAAEKAGYIADAETWLQIRELRNLAVHEYGGEAIDAALAQMMRLTPHLLATRRLFDDAPDAR
ncbi:MAG: hypothetical protein VKP62_14580 [Candidatus Sericytochromatia bacterium]|nr:hypothetical protein [Candidatus Sericytochromatia bacterium]